MIRFKARKSFNFIVTFYTLEYTFDANAFCFKAKQVLFQNVFNILWIKHFKYLKTRPISALNQNFFVI